MFIFFASTCNSITLGPIVNAFEHFCTEKKSVYTNVNGILLCIQSDKL